MGLIPCLSVSLCIFPVVRLPACPSLHPSVLPSFRSSDRTSICPFVRSSTCAVTYSFCPFLHLLSAHPLLCQSFFIFLHICPFVFLVVCPSVLPSLHWLKWKNLWDYRGLFLTL